MTISHEHYISFVLFFVPITDGQDNVVFTEEVNMSRPCLDTIMDPLWYAGRGEREEGGRGGGKREGGKREKMKSKPIIMRLVLQCALTTSHLSSSLSRELSLRRVWKKELKM